MDLPPAQRPLQPRIFDLVRAVHAVAATAAPADLRDHDFERAVASLRYRLALWDDDTTVARPSDYDAAVRGLVAATVREADAFLRGVHDLRCPTRREVPHRTAVLVVRDGCLDVVHGNDHPATMPPIGAARVACSAARVWRREDIAGWRRCWELCADVHAGRWVTLFGAETTADYPAPLLPAPRVLAEHDGELGPLLRRGLWMLGLIDPELAPLTPEQARRRAIEHPDG